MEKRRGQALVEFAFIAPMVFLMIFGMIYGAFMFIEYLHYSNAVRAIARQIAITDATSRTTDYLSARETELVNLYNESGMPKMYTPTPTITTETTDVVVTVAFEMDTSTYNSLPNLLKSSDDVSFGVGFPPKKINALQYRMKLENNS